MPAPRGKKGFHRVPLSSEESNTETETEPCGEELPMDIDDAPSMEGPLTMSPWDGAKIPQPLQGL